MRAKDLETLNANVDKVVKIVTSDGELLFAKVVLVSEEDEDVIYELVSTNRESQYEKFDEQPAYRIGFDEIQAVEPSPFRPGAPGPTATGSDKGKE